MTVMNDEELLYTQDELNFREKARQFVEEVISPIANDVETNAPWPEANWREFMLKIGSEGFAGLMIPQEYGGSGKSFMYQMLAGEEISAVSPALTMGFGASCTLSAIPILRFGTEEQKQKYLLPLVKGKKIGALAITEPNVGSDTAGMETTAIWDENKQV